MTPKEAQELIFLILKTHDLPLSKEDIAWAFTQEKTAVEVVDYAERYLGRECFLGLEEMEIYEHIKATHLLKLHKSRDLSLVYTPSDEELCMEIELLRRSTEGYKMQAEVLRRQREVLEGIRKMEMGVKEAKGKLRERRRRKWVGERERLGVDIENLTIMLRHNLEDLMAEEKTDGSGTQATAAATAAAAGLVDLESIKSLLLSDDRAIEKLKRLAEETSVEGLQPNKEGDIVEKVQKMTVKLAALMTAVVRYRLDRTYFEALSAQEQVPEEEGVAQQEQGAYIAALKEDLESLDKEILDVAKISAEAEFLRPVVGVVKKRRGLLEEVVCGRGKYIRDVLIQLQARNQHTINLLEKDLYRRKALKELSTKLEIITKSPLPQPRERTGTGGNKSSTPPPHGTSTNTLTLSRTPGGKASTSPTKHLPVHLRRAAAYQSSYSSTVPPSTPKRTAGKYTPRRRRRDRTGGSDDYSDDDYDEDDDGGLYDGEDPEITLLLHLGVSLPPHLTDAPQTPGTPFARVSSATDTPTSAKSTRVHLMKQLHSLRQKLTQQETQLDKSLRAAILSSISEAAGVRGIINGQVWADHEFGVTSRGGAEIGGALAQLIPEGLISEEGVRRRIGEVEGEVDRLSRGMGRIVKGVEELKETEGAGAGYGAIQARERFVGRWGRGVVGWAAE